MLFDRWVVVDEGMALPWEDVGVAWSVTVVTGGSVAFAEKDIMGDECGSDGTAGT